jgi:hypothetical protein
VAIKALTLSKNVAVPRTSPQRLLNYFKKKIKQIKVIKKRVDNLDGGKSYYK